MNRIVCVLFVVLGFAAVAKAQDKVGAYPYNVFEKKPLKVGTSVWVNVGDNDCAYRNKWTRGNFQYPLPNAADDCFVKGSYVKAKVVAVYSTVWEGYVLPITKDGKTKLARIPEWWYRVEIFFPPSPDGDNSPIYWSARMDRAYTFYNLPAQWKGYSNYLVLLNW